MRRLNAMSRTGWKDYHDYERGIFNTISIFSLCLLIMDAAWSGGGKWLSIGPISFRMFLFAICVIGSIPSMLKEFKSWLKNPMFLAGVGFMLYLFICAIVGFTNHTRMDVLITDLKGFAWLMLAPAAMALINSKVRLNLLMKSIIFGAVLQAIFILTLNMICYYYSDWTSIFYYPMIDLRLGFVTNITYSMFRIFFRSGPYLIIACILLIYLQVNRRKLSFLSIGASAICFYALLFSFSRSFYGATVVITVVLVFAFFVFIRQKVRKVLVHLVLSVVLALIMIIAQSAVTGSNYLKFAIMRTLSVDYTELEDSEVGIKEDILKQQAYIEQTKNADNVRKITTGELKKMMAQSPIFGNGLGAAIEYRADGLVENFYMDIINKMGIVGLTLYHFPIIYMVYFLIKWRKKVNDDQMLTEIVLLAGLLVFLMVNYFNPYMNASLGISYYSITIGGFEFIRKTADKRYIRTVISEDNLITQAKDSGGTVE